MAWTTPLTAVADTALTAAQWNASVRDNLLATAPAMATAANRIFVTTGAGAIAERRIVDDVVESASTTTSASYTDPSGTIGPEVTDLTTGSKVFVWINSLCQNATAYVTSFASFEATGATTSAAIDGRAVSVDNAANSAISAGRSTLLDVNAGVNTFRMVYRVNSGTGSFSRRRIQVMAL